MNEDSSYQHNHLIAYWKALEPKEKNTQSNRWEERITLKSIKHNKQKLQRINETGVGS